MWPIIITVIAGIYILFNGWNKGTLQAKIQVVENNGYIAGAERKANSFNLIIRWVIFLLIFFLIGWIEAIILFIVSTIGFYIGFKLTKDKYIDPQTQLLRYDVFAKEIENNPMYQENN